MNTILTDDEMPTLPAHPRMLVWPEDQLKLIKAYADAREAAVLAKLAQQEPALLVRCELPQHKGQWMAEDGRRFLLSDPAPQQADRQRVPEGWRETLMAAQKALHRATLPMTNSADMQKIHAALHQANELLAAALEAPQTEQAAVQACSDERPCIPCYTDNGLCADLASAPEAPAQCDTPRYCESVQRCTADDERRASTPAQASAVDERAAFEAWVTELGVAMHYEGDGHYGNATVARWWEAWQARAALAQKGGK